MTLPFKLEAPLPVFLAMACLFPCPNLRADRPSPVHSVEVSHARDFGIVMGETLTVEIRVAVDPDYVLETASLPAAGGSVSDYLEVRGLRWEKLAGAGETVYRIALTYQAFKGAREPEILSVPVLPLRFATRGATADAQVPAWNFVLNPLIPAKAADEDVAVRGDLPPPMQSPAGHRRLLGVFLTGLLGLGLYAALVVGVPPFRRAVPPFIRAASGLKALGRKSPDPEIHRQGARLVHAAINETAGRTVFGHQLGGFLDEFPRFEGCRSELAAFFGASERLFFAGGEAEPGNYPLPRMEALCRALASARGRRS